MNSKHPFFVFFLASLFSLGALASLNAGIFKRIRLEDWLREHREQAEIFLVTPSEERFVHAPEFGEGTFKTVFTVQGSSLLRGKPVTGEVSLLGGMHANRHIYSTTITPADSQIAVGKESLLFVTGSKGSFRLAGSPMACPVTKNQSGALVATGGSESMFVAQNRKVDEIGQEAVATAKKLGIK